MKISEIKDFEKQTVQTDFWQYNSNAQRVMQEIKSRRLWVDKWNKLHKLHEELNLLLDMAVEEDDKDSISEVIQNIGELSDEIENLELQNMVGGEHDQSNAIFTIHPGAGGTESQDWAEMLLRMYLRWIESHDYRSHILDLQPGEEAGIKSVTVEVEGDFAYGYLKTESGVHRLIRLSPFDSNKRRHTSFASVFVYPEIENDFEVEINPSELRIDTYRSSGAGGQHVNVTDSAVRITHIPSGIVVQCQNERSQHKNKANAMKVLKARLYQKQLDQEMEKLQKIEASKKEIAWGSQIRTYVFHPYTMVKDHRTNIETGKINDVLNGDIDAFIRGYLVSSDMSKT